MSYWLEVQIIVPSEGYQGHLDLVSNVLMDCGAGGVVLEDPALMEGLLARGTRENVALKPEQTVSVPSVKAYFPVDQALPGRLEEIQSALHRLGLPGGVVLGTRQVNQQDWSEMWRSHYKPFRVGRRLVIRPSWEDYHPDSRDLVLVLDPGMAFGCGTHPTTAMCMRLLEEYIRGGEMVCDIGTGSGILAITAARLGARRVLAVDLDELAVRTAQENIARNRVERVVQVVHGNLLDMVFGRADLVVANILADVITDMTLEVCRMLVPGGRFIASGIFRDRGEEVRQAIYAAGLEVEHVCMDGDWLAIVAGKETWRLS